MWKTNHIIELDKYIGKENNEHYEKEKNEESRT